MTPARFKIPLAAILLLTTGCGDVFLLHPSTTPFDAQGAHRLTFDHNGKKIEVYSALSPGALAAGAPQAFALYFTGNASRAESSATPLARYWGSRPVEVWAMNYPGYGGSAGSARLTKIQDAALATYDQLAKRAAGRPIFVTGYSMGAVAALSVAAHRPTAGMILQSPPPLPRVIMQRYGWWNLWILAGTSVLQLPADLNALSTAPQIKAPALFILSGSDTLIPLHYQQLVVDAYAGDKQILLQPNAEHNTPMSPADQLRLQANLDWLWARTIPPTANKKTTPSVQS
jgi:uncharacterized protein